MNGLLGKKRGMTQVFSAEGELIPVSVVEAGPCPIVALKTVEKDGYAAIQLGFEKIARRYGKKLRGKTPPFRHLREFSSGGETKVGDLVTAAIFKPGDRVEVMGITKGKGFQGVIKRHGKAGGPASHGSRFHRTTGSIGQRTSPGEVFKNMKLPGHMGVKRVTTKNLEVIEVRGNLLLLKGAVPGAKEAILEVRKLRD